jgi:hypothetical protein
MSYLESRLRAVDDRSRDCQVSKAVTEYHQFSQS